MVTRVHQALKVLKHAGTPKAAEYLTQIAQDSSVGSVVRQTAALHASQVAGKTPGKSSLITITG